MSTLGPPPFKTPFLNKNGTVEPNLWQRFLVDLNQQADGAAPADAGYLVTQAAGALTGETNLGALTSGYLSITVALGVATVSSSAAINASGLTGTLPDAVFPSTLPAVNGSNLSHLTGANVDLSVVTKAFADTGYVAVANQTVLVNATAGATTIKFPATLVSGKWVTVKKIDASVNAVTFDGNGHNIDGIASQALPLQWNSMTALTDGAAIYLVASI